MGLKFEIFLFIIVKLPEKIGFDLDFNLDLKYLTACNRSLIMILLLKVEEIGSSFFVSIYKLHVNQYTSLPYRLGAIRDMLLSITPSFFL